MFTKTTKIIINKSTTTSCTQKQNKNEPAQQHNNRVCLCRDESQQKHVSASAIVALKHRIAQLSVPMERNFLALGAHQMVDYVAEI